LGGGAADLTQFGFTAEFIGAVIGIIALARSGIRGEGVKLRGDNKAALKLGREEKVSGAEAINAAIVMSTVCVKFGIEINETEVMVEIGYRDKPILDLTEDGAAMRLIEACRPGTGIGSEMEFRTLWGKIRDASNELGMSEGDRTV
jgi:hypothetical protein